MAKLYFRYGAVGSAKTLNLLAVAHAYKQQGKRALLAKPALDDRFGAAAIQSRAGLNAQADLLVSKPDDLAGIAYDEIHCLLVDEAQFLCQATIEELHRIARDENVPVICYGLRGDFRTRLFAGSQRLMELADAIEEVKTTCRYCNRKAVFNLKHVDGEPTRTGPVIQLGAEETYLPTCASCYEQAFYQAAGKDTGANNLREDMTP